MKKYIGAICSGIASLFTFIFLALPAWGIKGMGENETLNGYELISGKKGIVDFTETEGTEALSAWTKYRVFAIILIILAVIALLYTVFMVLVNLNVIKVSGSWIDLANKILISVMVFVSLITLINVLSIVGDMAKLYSDAGLKTTVKQLKEAYDSIGTKAGMWFVLIFNALACGAVWALPIVLKDKAAK